MINKLPLISPLAVFAFILGGALNTRGTTVTFTNAGSATWTCPAGIKMSCRNFNITLKAKTKHETSYS